MAKNEEELFMDNNAEAEVVKTSRDLVGDLVVGEGVPSASKKTKKTSAPKAKKEAKPKAKKAEVEEAPVVDEVKPERPKTKHWYAVSVASGYENKVKVNLEKRIEHHNMSDKIFRVVIPQKTVTQVKKVGGETKRVEKDEKEFPGYVLVEMIMDDNTWYVVRHTAGVTGFVGTKNTNGKKNTAFPLKESEIKKILGRTTPSSSTPQKIELDVKEGDQVRIISGPFADFVVTVTKVFPEKAKVSANVSMFGRETPVELEYRQIQKL